MYTSNKNDGNKKKIDLQKLYRNYLCCCFDYQFCIFWKVKRFEIQLKGSAQQESEKMKTFLLCFTVHARESKTFTIRHNADINTRCLTRYYQFLRQSSENLQFSNGYKKRIVLFNPFECTMYFKGHIIHYVDKEDFTTKKKKNSLSDWYHPILLFIECYNN